MSNVTASPETAPPNPVLRRATLAAEMGAAEYELVVQVTHALISRRFATMQRLVSVQSTDVNINPFLMLAMAPAYNILSPFEAAEYVQNSKMPHGDATAFGRFVEEKIFPIFGTALPPEKAASPTVFSSIDGELTVENVRYLATFKAGPWTMNQSHAHEMIQHFPAVHAQTGCDIIIGITYGRRDRVNNKPRLVERGTGPYVRTLVGKELWEFLTGVENAHIKIYDAIREAQRRFAEEHGGKTFYEHMIGARLLLAESFRESFALGGVNDDMWESIFERSF